MFRNPTADLIVVLVIVLLIFGPKRLPTLGRQLGQGLREFKDSITGDSKSSEEEDRPALEGGSPAAAATPPPAQPAATEAAPVQAPAEPSQPAERPSAEVGSERGS